VFTGNGQNLHQITSKTVQLVTIDVTIVLGRGRFLFDGTVPGMDQAEYECTFVLKNLSDKAEDVQVGFPVDSQFARDREPDSPKVSANWVLEYGFIARDEGTTYHVEYVHRTPKPNPGEFASVFVWKMNFAPKETRTLSVQYRIPISMGLASTTREDAAEPPLDQALGQELLNIAQVEMAGYVTATGSSWAGNVETASFTVITGPFERYLRRRGLSDDVAPGTDPESKQRLESSFPVAHPWWFRRAKPEGWSEVKGGLQWRYKDFKPKDPIEVSCYVTQIPERPEEVGPFVDRFLERPEPGESATTELAHLREIVLATYGKEPGDRAVKAFASGQLWYRPQKDF
jgi:hypothetical protein